MKSGCDESDIKSEPDISPDLEPEANLVTAVTQLNNTEEDNMDTVSKKSQYGHNRRVKLGMSLTILY